MLLKNQVITRKGILNLKSHKTSNQCARPGHEVYLYELAVLFTSDTKLDENGFIIDHQLFDDAVQLAHVNSCEIMSNEILNATEKVLRDKQLECLGIKLQIKPAFVVEENSAYFREYRCAQNTDLSIVMNL